MRVVILAIAAGRLVARFQVAWGLGPRRAVAVAAAKMGMCGLAAKLAGPDGSNLFPGERLEEIRASGSLNFYRRTFLSDRNRDIVQAAARGDTAFLIRHLVAQDATFPELFDDERVERRSGLQRIVKALKDSPPCQVVDVGCGNAELLKRLAALGHDVTGVDLSPLRLLRNRGAIRKLHLGLAEDLPLPDACADVVIATELLEHACNLEMTLREVVRILRSGGIFHCQVPLGGFADGDNHVRHFNEETLRYVLEQVGFKIHSLTVIPYLCDNTPNNIYAVAGLGVLSRRAPVGSDQGMR